MLQIKPFPYASDNIGYLIYGRKKAMAVDGGAVSGILAHLENTGLVLAFVANTHSHPDHTVGNADLLEKTDARFLGFEVLTAEGAIEIEGNAVEIMHTPGHTPDSVCFYFNDILISGDTLFNGKVGRCFTGDHAGFLRSIRQILRLPEETKVYAGHDYVMEYLDFSKQLEPDNPYIEAYRRKYDPDNLFYTLGEEIRVNPYLRINDEKIAAILKDKGLPSETEFERWQSLLSLM